MDILEESQNLTLNQLEKRKLLKKQLQKVAAEEEILWKTRARQRWLKEGDGNTKFFHAMANGRRRENSIFAVEDVGRTIYREEEKREYFYNKFKEIYTPDTGYNGMTGDWSSLYMDRTIPNPDHLTLPFSLDEIKKATFQLGADKAPGLDGFNLRFF